MGDFTRSYANSHFKPHHYIVAWRKSQGKCWFCGVKTYMGRRNDRKKTCFSVLDKSKGVALYNVVTICEACASKRKYKTPDEYREYLYLEEVNKVAQEKGDPGTVTRLLFWGETHDMDYYNMDEMFGSGTKSDEYIQIGDWDRPDGGDMPPAYKK